MANKSVVPIPTMLSSLQHLQDLNIANIQCTCFYFLDSPVYLLKRPGTMRITCCGRRNLSLKWSRSDSTSTCDFKQADRTSNVACNQVSNRSKPVTTKYSRILIFYIDISQQPCNKLLEKTKMKTCLLQHLFKVRSIYLASVEILQLNHISPRNSTMLTLACIITFLNN